MREIVSLRQMVCEFGLGLGNVLDGSMRCTDDRMIDAAGAYDRPAAAADRVSARAVVVGRV